MLRKSLREILEKSSVADALQDLEKLLEDLVEEYRPVSIILAGSLARGRFVRGLSDIDILVVTERSIPKDKRFLLKAVKDVDVEVTVISLDELTKAVKGGNEFYLSALMHGIEVYGNMLEHVAKWRNQHDSARNGYS